MPESINHELMSRVTEQFATAFWRIRRGTAKELRPLGLTFSQGRALRVLARFDEPIRIGELAARLDIVPRSATAMVDTLEKAGLASRTADPSDRRSVLVGLTDGGRALLARMAEARRESAEALFGRLDAEQLSTLQKLLDVMNAAEPACGKGEA
jgi:DNA-binding MarR family transcriptional regulator